MSGTVTEYPSAPQAQWRGRIAVVLLPLAVAGLFTAWRCISQESRMGGDTYSYVRLAYILDGKTDHEASVGALHYVCSDPHYYNLKSCGHQLSGPTASSRYTALFTGRVGYPLPIAALLPAIGTLAVDAVTIAFALACGVLLYVLARELRLARGWALLATALFYVSPAGDWVTDRMAEGPLIVGLLVALIGVCRLFRDADWRPGFALVFAGLAWMVATKSANGVATALAFAVVAGAYLLAPNLRRVGTALGATSLLVLAGYLLAARLFHLPSLNETLQDTVTAHFRRPDVPDPLRPFLALDRVLLRWTWMQTDLRVAYILIGVGAVALVVCWRARGLALTAALLVGAAMPFAHPIRSNAERLLAPVWPILALAVVGVAAALLDLAARPGSPVRRLNRTVPPPMPLGVPRERPGMDLRESRWASGRST
jgi:hypothetical protein